MSKISLAPNAAGTAIFTIESPGTSTNRTLTLPDDTGTIVTNSGNQAGSFTTLNTSGQVVFNDAGADVDFRVEGDTDANLLWVDASADKVGIGAGTISEKLTVGGKIQLRGSNPPLVTLANAGDGTNAFDVDTTTTVGNGDGLVRFYNNTVQKCRIEGDGSLQNATNSYGSLSDIKLKENIVDALSQWNDIKTIKVRNYNFKEETGHQTHTQIGVIAQEVESVSPGLVRESIYDEGDEPIKSVNYSVLYMKAVKALQEAMERIETLEAKVAALENA